jgi:transcriptional regulator with XRE-family HTH domain
MPAPPDNALGDMCRNYRQLAGLKQSELAALTARLAADGLVSHAIDQRRISLIESGARKPHEHTLIALATALAHALQAEGYDGADTETLLKHLRGAKGSTPGVPAHVAAFIAEIAPYPGWYQTMLIDLVRAMHKIISSAIQGTIRNIRRRRGDIPPVDGE